jgi:hypothetical protein
MAPSIGDGGRAWRGLAGAVAAALLLLGGGRAGAQNFGFDAADYFRFDLEPATSRSGQPILAGYIDNDRGYYAMRVVLLVEQLDAAGQVVGTSHAFVDSPIPPHGRAYIEVPVPVAGARYRVRALYFDWRGGGPS